MRPAPQTLCGKTSQRTQAAALWVRQRLLYRPLDSDRDYPTMLSALCKPVLLLDLPEQPIAGGSTCTTQPKLLVKSEPLACVSRCGCNFGAHDRIVGISLHSVLLEYTRVYGAHECINRKR